MFTTRLISGIVLVIIAAFLLVEGSTVLYFGSMAISLIGLYELYRVMKIERSTPGFVGYAAVVAYYWIMGNREQYVTFLAIISLMILMTIYVVTFPKYGTEQITVAFFLCGDHVLLPLSGAGDAGRKIPRVADPFKLLGL